MKTKQAILCNTIIHSCSVATAAVGAGMAQAPGSDSSVIVPIQLGMVIALGKVFNIQLTKAEAEAQLLSAIAAKVGRAASKLFLGCIPGYGNAIKAVTAASITETIGWAIADSFSKKGA